MTEKDIQEQMGRLDSINRQLGLNDLNAYGIIKRSQIKRLLMRGWFKGMSNTVSGIVRYDRARGVGRYFLLGVQYHKPAPIGLKGDFHRLTERDVKNVAEIIKHDKALMES